MIKHADSGYLHYYVHNITWPYVDILFTYFNIWYFIDVTGLNEILKIPMVEA